MQNFNLEENLEAHYAAAYTWALHCCGYNQDLVQDIMQAVYLKILDGKAIFKGKSSFKTWLFSIIKNTAFDYVKKSKRSQQKLTTTQVLENTLHDTDLAKELEDKELTQLMKEALQKLPERQREVLYLVFYHDCTLKEVAKITQISIGSVRKHYDRGKKRLNEDLKNLDL
ncbi:hypothetical protein BKI52_31795 [marine bacterium AO1-C]|nr:hypothetical protein BKI52_31795 [marine bacterium AO1-C]